MLSWYNAVHKLLSPSPTLNSRPSTRSTNSFTSLSSPALTSLTVFPAGRLPSKVPLSKWDAFYKNEFLGRLFSVLRSKRESCMKTRELVERGPHRCGAMIRPGLRPPNSS